MSRQWTVQEENLLRAHYLKSPPSGLKVLAKELGRPTPSVAAKAAELGLRRKRPCLAGTILLRLRAFQRGGHSLRFIAAELQVSTTTVMRWLKRLGLPARKTRTFTGAGRKERKAKLRTWLRSNGRRALVDTRRDQERVAALCRWPVAYTVRQADVLDALAKGPMTLKAIASALAITPRAARLPLDDLRRTGAVVDGERVRGAKTYAIAAGLTRAKRAAAFR